MSRREYGIIAAGFVLIVALVARFLSRKEKQDGIILFSFLVSVGLKFLYISATPTWERQHDVIGFANPKGIGQAAYIEWFINNNRLPDFDPRSIWGFFQPPLHHILSAIWIKLNLGLGYGYTAACENLQVLTCFYGIVFLVLAYFIFREMGLEDKGLKAAFCFVAFHPSFILLSGSVNNDMLMHVFIAMAIFWTLRWIKTKKWTHIALIALSIGLSMMTKLAGVLLAPATAVIFLYELIDVLRKKDRGGFIGLIKQYFLFGLIVFPLGLFFPLRNLVLFGVPLNYTPPVGEPVGMHSVFDRLFNVITDSPFVKLIQNGDSFDEFNVPLAFIKTSLTGEYNFAGSTDYVTIFAWGLFLTGTFLYVLITAYAIYRFCRVKLLKEYFKLGLECETYIYILVLTAFIFYFNLCFSIPFFSSQDFRYIAFLVIPMAFFLGCVFRETKNKALKMCLVSLISMFALCASLVYFLLCMP
ncbi:MAG: glycosyltransferase family 39 protein [Lachnospiraceae bacterium]|nr:glycosyltransferase family 39 protein [Lachnospiraceae bacterium]